MSAAGMDLTHLSLVEAAQAIVSGKTSSEEVTRACLDKNSMPPSSHHPASPVQFNFAMWICPAPGSAEIFSTPNSMPADD